MAAAEDPTEDPTEGSAEGSMAGRVNAITGESIDLAEHICQEAAEKARRTRRCAVCLAKATTRKAASNLRKVPILSRIRIEGGGGAFLVLRVEFNA